MTPELDRLVVEARDRNASDLHLVAGVPPAFRVTGEILLADRDALTTENLVHLTNGVLTKEQNTKFHAEWELCISVFHETAGRMRMTFYRRNGMPELSIRFCGDRVRTREELGLPVKIDELARKQNGLILITGPAGTGKTTTLNYLVNLINEERRCKIVTIEDPIEFTHRNKRAIVVQQEVLSDTHSFSRALIHVLRLDPDVIVVGEIRDHEAIATAITAAETGHLVLATLHSPTSAQALERIVGVYEGNAQRQISLQLGNCLQGVIAQDLLPSVDRTHRVLAYEMLIATPAVRKLIRENQLHQVDNCMQMGGKEGMLLMDGCLQDLYRRGVITYDTAYSRWKHPEHFAKRLS
jgi:twitching motility protein PilT